MTRRRTGKFFYFTILPYFQTKLPDNFNSKFSIQNLYNLFRAFSIFLLHRFLEKNE